MTGSKLANSTNLEIEMRGVTELVPYSGNARTHSQDQIRQIARSIERFGFVNPVLIDEAGQIVAGHGRVRPLKRKDCIMVKRKEKPKKPPAPLNAFEKAIQKESFRKLTVRLDGHPQQLTPIEFLFRKMLATAADGSPLAKRSLLSLLTEIEQRNAEIIEDKCQIWSDYKDAQNAEIEKAARKGEPIPDPLPHPDDIKIYPGEGVRILGPMTEEEVRLYQKACRLRDVLLLQHALDARLGALGPGPNKTAKVGAAYVLALGFDKALPKRMQLADMGFAGHWWTNKGKTKNELLKETYRGWKELEFSTPRGSVMGPVEPLRKVDSAVRRAIEEVQESNGTPQEIERIVDRSIRNVCSLANP